MSANAYLGCWGIVEALSAGADIVVTGRVTDAAVVCGPAAHHHGWRRDDFDALAGAVVAGHVIECSAQATGGNYSFFEEIPGIAHIGFPWAEIAADGSSVIGKHYDTGGAVTVGTITSQILYEIGGPDYFGPDVIAHFDTIDLEQVAADRVRISGVRGSAPTGSVKVADERTRRLSQRPRGRPHRTRRRGQSRGGPRRVLESLSKRRERLRVVHDRVVRREHVDPTSNEAATAELRISVKDPDERLVGRAFSNAMVETALSSIPGMYLLSGGPSAGQPYGIYRPALVPAALVPQYAHIDGRTILVDTPTGSGPSSLSAPSKVCLRFTNRTGRRSRSRSVDSSGTRSGDKGGDANLGCSPATMPPTRGWWASSRWSVCVNCCPRSRIFPSSGTFSRGCAR